MLPKIWSNTLVQTFWPHRLRNTCCYKIWYSQTCWTPILYQFVGKTRFHNPRAMKTSSGQLPMGRGLVGGERRQRSRLAGPSKATPRCTARTFGALPGEEERDWVSDYLSENTHRREEAQGDLVWALLNSAEFRFNH